MNTERLLELADHIDGLPYQPIIETNMEEAPTAFNMGTWHCGAVCCIGGWAETLFVPNKRHRGYEATAAWALGLDELTADELFYPDEDKGWPGSRYGYDAITPAMASTVIRNLVETGKVDWSIAARQLEREHAA